MDSHSTAEEQFRRLQEAALAEYGVSATSRFVDIQTPPAHVHVLESGIGEPLVMVSGNAPAMLWAPLAARLASRFHLLMPDRPGTGLTTTFNFRGVDLRSHGVEFLRGTLDALGLDRVAIAGNSMGGFFAMAFAMEYPEMVSKLILLGETGNSAGGPVKRFYRLVGTRGLNAVLHATVLRPPKSAAEARAGLTRSRLVADPDRVSDALLEGFAAGARMPGVSRSFRTMVERVFTPKGIGLFGRPTAATYAVTPELEKLTSPTLFLWGDQDPLGTPDIGRMLAGKMPHARLQVVEDAGHLPWLDQLDFCTEVITGFLTEGAGTPLEGVDDRAG
jgi:pimeloyl-ACP methyl ester carboxylesterase